MNPAPITQTPTPSKGLTTAERRDVRQGLLDLGFHRGTPLNWDQSTHLDKGDGAYTEEWWGPGDTHLTLTWLPKRVTSPETTADTNG